MIKQLSIFVENKPGRLAEVTRAIGDAGVDLRALSIADTSDFGILRLIVNKPQEAVDALKKAGLTVSLTDVLAVGINDAPGAFADVVQLLTDNGIVLEYMYAFISRCEKQAVIILRIEELERAISVLRQRNVRLLSEEEVYRM